MQKILEKSKLKEFLTGLSKKYRVIAPVKESKEAETKFKVIEKMDFDKIDLKENTLFPPKNFFIPDSETILEFNGKLKEPVSSEKTIIFGIRKCDINALKVLDNVMKDQNYIQRRKNTILIGVLCENPDKFCFCNSMELQDDYDLFFYPNNGDYYISIGSTEGEKLVKNLKNAKKEIVLQEKNFKEIKDKNIERNYKNKIWQTDSDKCLGCSACTVYCPTCNCFDLKDTLTSDLKSGKRIRKPASCQLMSFSRVAGGKVFRESKEARFKHFVYHKIAYYKKRYGRYMCVGCGRCLRVCPTRIDWTNTINLLKDEENSKIK